MSGRDERRRLGGSSSSQFRCFPSSSSRSTSQVQNQDLSSQFRCFPSSQNHNPYLEFQQGHIVRHHHQSQPLSRSDCLGADSEGSSTAAVYDYRRYQNSLSIVQIAEEGDTDTDDDDDEDDPTIASYFSDDRSLTEDDDDAETTASNRQRRKRKCVCWLMAVYMIAAAITFGSVLIWRMGVFSSSSNDLQVSSTLTAGEGYGFDDRGRMLCNGLALNCHRRANEIMYATVHNAMSSRDDGFLAYNNLYPLEDALRAGFRGLALDSCDCTRVGIQLCHGLCLAGFRKPIPVFQGIVDFMNKFAHEVVIIELQISEQSLGPLFQVLQEVQGLADLLYQHPGEGTPWPKLQDMIERNKRLIIFAHDDLACEEEGQCPMGVHPTFKYAFETPFDSKSVEQLMDTEATCLTSRGWSNSSFVISNHFANNERGLPDMEVAVKVNDKENLQARLDACQSFFQEKYGQEVINLLVVDFWNIGHTLEVVREYNSALPALTEAPTFVPSMTPTESPAPSQAPSPPPTPPRIPIEDVLFSTTPTKSPGTMEPTFTTSSPTFSPLLLDDNKSDVTNGEDFTTTIEPSEVVVEDHNTFADSFGTETFLPSDPELVGDELSQTSMSAESTVSPSTPEKQGFEIDASSDDFYPTDTETLIDFSSQDTGGSSSTINTSSEAPVEVARDNGHDMFVPEKDKGGN